MLVLDSVKVGKIVAYDTDGYPESDDHADPDLDADRPGWPKVVGILSITFASLSLFCGLAGSGFALASEPILAALMGSQRGDAPPPPFSPPMDAILVVSIGLSLALNILLLVAGVRTLRRSPNGRSLHLIYVLAAVVSTGFGVYAQLHGQMRQERAMDAWLEQHSDTQFGQAIGEQVEQQRAGSGVTTLLSIGVGMAVGLAWPAFCGFWFGPMGKKPDATPERDATDD